MKREENHKDTKSTKIARKRIKGVQGYKEVILIVEEIENAVSKIYPSVARSVNNL
jgi:hypothetical protein